MPDRVATMTESERVTIVSMLVQILGQLDRAGEALAAVHVSQALDCLDPDSPINRQDTRKLH